jgi:hypothetical protein
MAIRIFVRYISRLSSVTPNFRDANYQCLGFEFLTVADMNSSVSWGITLCNPFEAKRRFEATYLLHLQG